MIFRTAKRPDVSKIKDWLYNPPPGELKNLEDAEILSMIENGIYVILIDDSQRIIGQCYCTDPNDERASFEFGGIYIDPSYQGYGLGYAMGLIAMTMQILTTPDLEAPHIFLAHVVAGNENPIKTLERLHFQGSGELLPVDTFEAISHMDPGGTGSVMAQELFFKRENIPLIFNDFIGLLETKKKRNSITDTNVIVWDIDINLLSKEHVLGALEELPTH